MNRIKPKQKHIKIKLPGNCVPNQWTGKTNFNNLKEVSSHLMSVGEKRDFRCMRGVFLYTTKFKIGMTLLTVFT